MSIFPTNYEIEHDVPGTQWDDYNACDLTAIGWDSTPTYGTGQVMTAEKVWRASGRYRPHRIRGKVGLACPVHGKRNTSHFNACPDFREFSRKAGQVVGRWG